MLRKLSRVTWFLILLVIASLSCNLFSNLQERVSSVQGTVQSVRTDIQEGRNLYGTAQAIATQVGNSGLLETALAAVTEVGESGLLQTAQAFATEQGPGLIATVQAFATQEGDPLISTAQALATEQGSILLETAQAVVTDQGPGAIETAQALLTQVAGSLGQTPPDIPIIEGNRSAFFASSELITYFIDKPYAEVEEFYRQQMPANGWTLEREEPQSVVETIMLVYLKAERRAAVNLYYNPAMQLTAVMITLNYP